MSTIKRTMGELGIIKPSKIHRNLSYSELLKHETQNKEGVVMKTKYGDTFSVSTGKFTGRSPKDKWIVRTSSSNDVWWGEVNQPTTPEVFEDLLTTAVRHYNTLDSCYVFDGYCGVSSQKKVRFFHEMAWQQHFVKNMFISPSNEDLDSFEPDFTIINACSEVNNEWEKHNLNSEVAIAFNLERKLAVILGTWYGGENKKGMFSLMHYWLPKEGIMTMHCSANVGTNGDTALFFGLSGTGKTTLSADTDRALIGDDEHGWDDDGVFNFEGGCYAKTINLSAESEPEIFATTSKFGTVIENMVYDAETKELDFNNDSLTANMRCAYPLEYVSNASPTGVGGHPKNIIMLTCDSFGVLPPIARLTPAQAMYHFLSGFTAKVAGTERGVTEPQPTFSTCFGAPFMPRRPEDYGNLLRKKIANHGATCWLVNTGWTGGAYGHGSRMPICATRALLRAALDGSLSNGAFRVDQNFGFEVPTSVPGVADLLLEPRRTWEDRAAYDEQSAKLVSMFAKNFEQYLSHIDDDVRAVALG